MKFQSRLNITIHKHQEGMALIVVLMLLILITLVGVIVVRNSNTDLRLATASQIDSLLFITAEQPLSAIEQEAENPTTNLFDGKTGLFGYFTSQVSSGNDDNEIVLCFRPQEANKGLSINNAIVYVKGSGTTGSSSAYCQVGTPKDYISKRSASMAEMTISRAPTAVGSARFQNVPTEVNLTNATATNYSLNVDSVSLLPSYSSATTASINDCLDLQGYTNNSKAAAATLEKCLAGKGVPTKSVSQNYIAKYFEAILGSSTGGGSTGGGSTGGGSTGGNN